jgi:hypothetical protein
MEASDFGTLSALIWSWVFVSALFAVLAARRASSGNTGSYRIVGNTASPISNRDAAAARTFFFCLIGGLLAGRYLIPFDFLKAVDESIRVLAVDMISGASYWIDNWTAVWNSGQ